MHVICRTGLSLAGLERLQGGEAAARGVDLDQGPLQAREELLEPRGGRGPLRGRWAVSRKILDS